LCCRPPCRCLCRPLIPSGLRQGISPGRLHLWAGTFPSQLGSGFGQRPGFSRPRGVPGHLDGGMTGEPGPMGTAYKVCSPCVPCPRRDLRGSSWPFGGTRGSTTQCTKREAFTKSEGITLSPPPINDPHFVFSGPPPKGHLGGSFTDVKNFQIILSQFSHVLQGPSQKDSALWAKGFI